MTTLEQGLDMEALEGMLDQYGLYGVTDLLAAICAKKAEHARSNGNVEGSARLWERRAVRLGDFII